MSLHQVRIGLIFLLLGGGLLMQAKFGFDSAWYFYVTALVLAATHFLFANVWAAFGELRKGNALKAELMLTEIKKPEWLAKSPRAYYYFIKGMVDLQNKKLASSEKSLLQSLRLGLKTPNDNALVSLNLAHICYVENRRTEAKNLLEKAKSFNPNDLMLKENIKKMETAMGG